MNVLDLKQKLSFNLGNLDKENGHTTVLYMVYKTIEANKRLTVKAVKALLCVEYLIPEENIDSALAGLISRSMFDCVKRWKNPSKGVSDMQVSITEPPPEEFKQWLARAEDTYPELSMFKPPIFQYKTSEVS